jgi:hypothetical protein
LEADAIFDPDSDPSTHVWTSHGQANPPATSQGDYIDIDNYTDGRSYRQESENGVMDAQRSSDEEERYGNDGAVDVDDMWESMLEGMCESEDEISGVEESQEDRDNARRSAVLLDLAGAEPATLEELIKTHTADIDSDLLHLLYTRIEVSREFDEVCPCTCPTLSLDQRE